MIWLRQVWILVTAVSVLTAGLLVPAFAATEGSWSDPLNLSAPGHDAIYPEIGISADGRTIAAIWERTDKGHRIVQAKISTDGGSTWTNHNLSDPGRRARKPDVGVSADGRTIATIWTLREDDRKYTVQAKISTDRGRTWTKHDLSAPGQDAKIPNVGVSADGKTIATTWRRPDGRSSVVQAKISTDNGSTWSKHELSAPGQYARYPRVGVSADGKTIATTWTLRDDRSGYIAQAKISTDRGATWSTTHNLSAPGYSAGNPQVGVSADGKTIATTWHGNHLGGIEAKISTNNGATWTAHNLSTPGQGARNPQLGISADGKTIATTWHRNYKSNNIAQAKISTDSGVTWTLHNLSTPDQSASHSRVGVSADGKTIATTWNASPEGTVQAKISTDSGATWTLHNQLSAPGRRVYSPEVEVSADGRTIATIWNRYYGSHSVVQSSIYTARRPAAASAASYTPLKRNRTRARWTGSTGATGYRVLINGKTKCTTGPSKFRCTAKKAYGPLSDVNVIALGTNTDAPAVSAEYRKSSKTIVFGTVHFRPKSAKLTKKNKTIVRKKTKALARQGFKKTTVFGYTAKECNPKKLSKKRAETVKKVMLKKLRKMDVSMRIKTIAKGNKNPIGNNNTKKGRAKNRRATINIR